MPYNFSDVQHINGLPDINFCPGLPFQHGNHRPLFSCQEGINNFQIFVYRIKNRKGYVSSNSKVADPI